MAKVGGRDAALGRTFWGGTIVPDTVYNRSKSYGLKEGSELGIEQAKLNSNEHINRS